MTPTIELAGLGVRLASRTILDDLTCTLSGRTIGLLGPNGAGKTTFVKMLLSCAHPTAGRAMVFGRDSSEPDARLYIGNAVGGTR